MLNISKFLDRFKKNIESAELINNSIAQIIKNQTGVILKPIDFEIKNNTLCLKTSPAVNNKLFIYKEGLLKEINLKLKIGLIDIR